MEGLIMTVIIVIVIDDDDNKPKALTQENMIHKVQWTTKKDHITVQKYKWHIFGLITHQLINFN